MNIKRIVVGPLETNCYILENNNEVLIIDPGDNADIIIKNIGDKNVCGIIITHYHSDHVGALSKIKDYYNCNVYDINNLKEGINNINSFYFKIIFTPGHKDDLISIYFDKENVIFVGDFIFKNGIGRIDLEGGSYFDMINSINKIKLLPFNVKIYPGHGDYTFLKDEIVNLSNFIE